MKILLALIFSFMSTVVFGAFNPEVVVSVDRFKTINVMISNNTDDNYDCKYSVSWFVNTFSFKKEFGHIELLAQDVATLSFKNDEFSYLAGIKAHVTCE
jgi:hypothetical protein